MQDAYIVESVRTAMGSFQGSLSTVTAAQLGKTVIEALLERSGVEAGQVDEVQLGCVLQGGLGQNIARQASVAAGIPVEKTAMTLNMVCGSGLRAVIAAAQGIRCGDADVIIAGGTENMTLAPYALMDARGGYRMGDGKMVDTMIKDGLWEAFNDYHMGVTAENLAKKFEISREEQDAFAALSQQKAEAAQKSGRFDAEIVPVLVPQRRGDPVAFAQDEFPRHGTTAEKLAKLRPAFDKAGTVTAGNSSGINDGAAAHLIMSKAKCEALGLKPRARIAGYGYAGVDPAIMGYGPVDAVRVALSRAGWTVDDLELIEANEAFASQAISVNKALGWNLDIVNVNGGAIALGHPIGASGARILVTLVHEMEKRDVKKGLATLCIGGGMGVAVCIEREG